MSTRSDMSVIASVAHLLSLVLFVAALYFARDVFIPLALAILLSFLLNPLVTRLQRWGVSNTLSVIAVACLAFVCITGGLILIGKELTELVSELPQYREELVTKARNIAGLRSGMGDSLGELAQEVTEAMKPDESSQEEAVSSEENGADESTEAVQREADPTKADFESAPPQSPRTDQSKESSGFFNTWTSRLLERVEEPPDELHDGTSPKTPLYVMEVPAGASLITWATTAGALAMPLGTVGLVIVFVLFLLIYRDDLRDRIIMVISKGNYVLTTEGLTEVGRRISRYLVAQSIVNTSYGAVLAIGLFIIGRTLAPDGVFPNLILWGVLATLFRFVPYVGPIVGAMFPLIVSLIIFPGYSVFASVLGLIVLMELLSNNVMEPWLYGSSTGISAIAVIVAAVFWGWLWGPVGLLLSTPLTVCLVVLGRQVPRFRIFDTLLGEKVDIKPSIRFYQRLLAGNEHQATQLLLQHQQNEGVVSTCDDVIIPTIKRLRNDRLHGELTAASSVDLLEMLEGIVTQIDWPTKSPGKGGQASIESTASLPPPPERTICIGVPTHHCSDDIILALLRSSLDDIVDLHVAGDSELPLNIAQRIEDEQPALVVIANVPPGGFAQARVMCETIRGRGYEGPIVVACIGSFKHFDRLVVKFRKSGANFMTTTFRQTHLKIRSLVAQQKEPIAPTNPTPVPYEHREPSRVLGSAE